jgi:hypothetical protein
VCRRSIASHGDAGEDLLSLIDLGTERAMLGVPAHRKIAGAGATRLSVTFVMMPNN